MKLLSFVDTPGMVSRFTSRWMNGVTSSCIRLQVLGAMSEGEDPNRIVGAYSRRESSAFLHSSPLDGVNAVVSWRISRI
jgi:hypothetical protein